MRLDRLFALIGGVAVAVSASITAGAQPPAPAPSGTHMPRMGGMQGRMGRPMLGHGQIIGNKNSKVYHLPGDKGNMPAEKNRVYFRTEREAMAAGYHAAKSRKTLKPGMHGAMPHKMMGGGTQMPAHGNLPK